MLTFFFLYFFIYLLKSECQSKDWSKHRKLCRVLTKGILHPETEDFPEEYVRVRIGFMDAESNYVQHQFEITDTLKSIRQSFAEKLNTDVKNIPYGNSDEDGLNEPSILSTVDDEGRIKQDLKTHSLSSLEVDPATKANETYDGTILLRIQEENKNGTKAVYKVQATMKMKVIFGLFAHRQNIDVTYVRFFLSGNLVDPEDTPNSLHFEDQAIIQCTFLNLESESDSEGGSDSESESKSKSTSAEESTNDAMP